MTLSPRLLARIGNRLQDASATIQNALGAAGLTAPGGKLPAVPEFRLPKLDAFRAPLCDTAPGAAGRGAPEVPAGARYLSGSYSNAAGRREYRLYVPSRPPVGLVVMLHGCTQDADDFARGTGMNAAAEARDCLVLYPEQSNGANPQRCWNWFNAADQEAGRGEPSIIGGMTRQVAGEYGIGAGRVFVAGLSAGGAEAAIMAATYPELFAALGVHSGLPFGAARDMPGAFGAMRTGRGGAVAAPARPVIVFHGDRDTTVHPSNGEQVMTQFGASGTPRTEHGAVPGGHGYTMARYPGTRGRQTAELWTVHGAGHAWSGGDAAGSYTDPRGPDASAAMLRFFLEQPGHV